MSLNIGQNMPTWLNWIELNWKCFITDCIVVSLYTYIMKMKHVLHWFLISYFLPPWQILNWYGQIHWDSMTRPYKSVHFDLSVPTACDCFLGPSKYFAHHQNVPLCGRRLNQGYRHPTGSMVIYLVVHHRYIPVSTLPFIDSLDGLTFRNQLMSILLVMPTGKHLHAIFSFLACP